MHHLNPSMIPTTGFNEYKILHSLGITSLLNPTGEMYKPNCTMKGITYRKSRYLTFKAVIQRLGPRLAKKANNTNRGSNPIRHVGTNWYQIIMSIRIEKLIRKSTKVTTIVAVGTINLGKYTLLIKFELATKLLAASERAEEKKVQGNIPANTIKA